MKRVSKQASPAPFEAWKAQANADWQPTYAALQNPQKRVLHDALLAEQGHVCCYCGRSVDRDDSHIEHFRPQEGHDDLALEYSNLFASCIRETQPGAPLHCGHAKGHDFDEARAISPLDEGCEQRFLYVAGSGEIKAKDSADAAADYMIKLLKLDLQFLCNRREEVLKLVFDEAFMAAATDDELERLAQAYRQRRADGKLDGFGHVLARYAEQLLGRPVAEPAGGAA
ncbi:uncharacterized protein (TIGR02646 family) [Plasticicumulans lactativorans]|uniref:Uncharacterized protein (TIGR02646 family) n=1 Tax=Plasticicumulans lactativorans TaxID=1133106 RepID=A0A4V6NPJ8_9GAMM|nr:retron system putative HNH endonuclease [Plasticicumulans lactativorans]TCO81323.1 uncharacterized protein (TIGR02646 family) [Plasticicumulans lactativorans]